MKRCLLIIVTLFCMSSIYAQTSNLWQKVESFENQSLPKSALEVVNQIYKDALKNKNSADLIKAIIYQLKLETTIDTDQYPDRMKEIEAFAEKDENKIEQAVLYSLLANLYQNYLFSAYPRSTAVNGYVPENIREWPANVFIQKISDMIDRSLVPATELQQTPVLLYKEILTEGDDSRNLRPTLYDFLIQEGIKISKSLHNDFRTQNYFTQSKLIDPAYFTPVNEFIQIKLPESPYDLSFQILRLYQELLAFRHRDGNLQALLIADLDRLDFVYERYEGASGNTFYADALERLKDTYQADNYTVEILFREANMYLNQTNVIDQDSENDNLKKAYEIAQQGIKQYPGYERIGLLRNLTNSMTEGRLSASSDNVVYSDEDLSLKINYRNFSRIKIEIYKISASTTVYNYNWDRKGQYAKTGKLVRTEIINLINDYPYLFSDTTVKIPTDGLGSYEYVIKADRSDIEPANQQFSVSRLGSISRVVNNQREFLVVDRQSGKPIEGAQVKLYKRTPNQILSLYQTLITDAFGLVRDMGEEDIAAYNVVAGEDQYLITSFPPWISTYPQSNKDVSSHLNIFTDRSIYRPGQTVYFKGIAYENGHTQQRTLPLKNYTISFRDANGQEITHKQFTSNEFGSFAGEFVIPQGLLTGHFTLASDIDGGSTSFVVEEYKRPTFDIQFEPNKPAYTFGDKVTVAGNAKTLAGVHLQDAQVRYTVTRRNHWLYRGRFHADVQIAQDQITTDANGHFEIAFIPEKSSEDKNNSNVFYNYRIEATVTNSNGESQSSFTEFMIGDRSLYLTISGLQQSQNIYKSSSGLIQTLTKENLPVITINALNLSGYPINVAGSYEIYPLEFKDPTLLDNHPDNWIQGQPIVSANFESGKSVDINAFRSLASGKYRFIAKAKDPQSRDVEIQQDFIIASLKDQKPPIPTYEWLMTPQTECNPGESAEIILGSSARQVYVLYEIFKDKKKLSVERFILDNENKKIEIPFLESYGEGISAAFTYIKDEQLFTTSIEIRKKQPNKSLNLTMDVFRDHLLPGQKEEWRISVKDPDQHPVPAEILAGMYDASLDLIMPQSWNFYPNPTPFLWNVANNVGNEFSSSSVWLIDTQKDVPSLPYRYDSFNWFGGFNLYTSVVIRGGMVLADKGINIDEEAAVVENAMPKTQRVMADAAEPAGGSSNINETENVQIRQNFNETAFFYPQLRTDSEGKTIISFTVPESNTSWKFKALAHTQAIQYGQIEKEAISRKSLMVSPNVPRFMREGDQMSLSANLSNLSEESITGKVYIEFLDPETNRTNIALGETTQSFSIAPGQTTAKHWTFDVPSGIDLTTFKIVAQSASFSDGEQHLIPVLPNRLLVTESLPFNVMGKQTKEYTFDKLLKPSSSLSNYRLTLEFASNPTWYAVQALPSVTTPGANDESAISWFGTYYFNTMAAHIANSTPKIKQMIDAWTKQGSTKETLLSNLEKNQELKNTLLEETPWVIETTDESEQKQRLSLLFDLNRTESLNRQALSRLRSFQTYDGGWEWLKGFSSSPSVTQWILFGLGELSRLDGYSYPEDLIKMEVEAVNYIDEAFIRHYNNLKANNKDWQKQKNISTYELEYLFVRSYYPNIPTTKVNEALNFYLNLAANYWNKTSGLYDRAIAAIVMQRNNRTEIAQAIIQSLREHASHKDDLGMYWANNRVQSFMTQSATCLHTFIMQAFHETGSSTEEMDAMKLWLLKQKQTQQWESVPATLSAINILLKTGNNWLENEGDVTIQLGKQSIGQDQKEYGTGYLKKVYKSTSIEPDMGKVTISKSDDGPAWGALYWQYFENMDKITAAKTGLQIEKGLFIEDSSSDRKALTPVSANNSLRIGDKVTVRLTIRSDRDLEFVHLKDLRAACFEPVDPISGTQWQDGLIYYRSPKDASINFYFAAMPKGTYVVEYSLYVTASGVYSNGITTIQCLYAPEFISHTSGGQSHVSFE